MADDAEIEAMARRMAKASGHDPDAEVVPPGFVPRQAVTPDGTVYYLEKGKSSPLWKCYARMATVALK